MPTPSSMPIRIRSFPGKVTIEAPCLFADEGDSAIHAFIERVFDVPAVRAVDLDRRRAVIRIEFDRKALDQPAALMAFAAALENDRWAPRGESPPRFEGLSGPLRRVERRCALGREFTVAFVEGKSMQDLQRLLAPSSSTKPCATRGCSAHWFTTGKNAANCGGARSCGRSYSPCY